MNKVSVMALSSALCLLSAPIYSAGAAGVPPAGAKPLSSILASVEGQKIGTITGAEFDHGV